MNSAIEATNTLNTTKTHNSPQSKAAVHEKMDAIEEVVNPYLDKMGVVANPPSVIDANKAGGAIETLDEIRVLQGGDQLSESSTRRLLALLNRVATVVDKHTLNERDVAFGEEVKVRDETLADLQTYTKWQGGAYALSGVAAPCLLIFSALMGQPAAEAFRQIATSLTQAGGQTADKFLETWKMPGEHDRNLYFNSRSEREQAMQLYNQLPEKMQQLVSKLVDQVMAMYRTAGQRG